MRWLAICDRCGFRRWNSELKKEWTGLMVCSECFERRHPQEFLKGKADRQSPPWVRPEPTDVFDTDYFVREDGSLYFREQGFGFRRES